METGDHFKNGAGTKSYTSSSVFLSSLVIAALAVTAAFTSCGKDDDQKVKLLETITKSDGYTEKYEYDQQNRLTKFTVLYDVAPINPIETHEYTYNAGGDLVKREVKTVNPDNDFTEEYVKNGNTITITRKTSGLQDIIRTLELNSNGYPTKREDVRNDFIGGSTYFRTYSYKDGNLTKFSETRFHHTEGITVPLYDYEYEYDNKKSPRSNWKVPKWFVIWYFETTGSQNNVTKSTYFGYAQIGEFEFTRRPGQDTDLIYEYDSDGFPTKRTTVSNGFEILYEYKIK